MSKTSPIYIEIAQQLEQDISRGIYAVGDLLPTEGQLCKSHNISRFTARNALAILEDKSLIQRTQGRGSVVTSQRPSVFKDTWSSIDDLLAHASEVRMVVESIKEVQADNDLVSKTGFISGERLIQVDGVRLQTEKGKEFPLCTIRIWFLAQYASISENLSELRGSVLSLLEQRFGEQSVQVNQTISACMIDHSAAEKLEVAEGELALCLVRQFINKKDTVFEVSETMLPSTRFKYNMRLKRS